MNKTMLVFATRWGATKETGEEILKVMKEKYNIEADLIDLKEKASKKYLKENLDNYDNVILGASVAMFRWAKEGKKFLKKNKEILSNKKLFVYVSSGRAGKANQDNDLEEYNKWQKTYIDDVLEKIGLNFASRKAFGGVKKKKGDTRDWEKIRGWAEEIGSMINSGEN